MHVVFLCFLFLTQPQLDRGNVLTAVRLLSDNRKMLSVYFSE